jgi:PAS domain S-box-containing protein
MVNSASFRRMGLLAGAISLIAAVQLLWERDFERARETELQVEHTLRVQLHAFDQVLSVMTDAETGQLGYLLTGKDRYLQPYESAVATQRQAIRNLRERTTDNSVQRARLAELDRLVATKLSLLSRNIVLRRTEGSDAALAEVVDEGKRVMDQIRNLLRDGEEEEQRLLGIRTKAAETQALRENSVFSIGALVLLFGFLGAANERGIRKAHRAGEALRESEDRFRTLANAIPQLCWTADADGSISWYNERWYEYTGTTPREMEGLGWQSVHDPEVLPEVLERWKSSIANGNPFEMVYPLRAADGEFHPFLTRVMPVRDRVGQVVRWFGTNTDITEQRKTEQSLREYQERVRLAQQVTRVGTFELNLQTGVNRWTPELEAMYGLPPGGFAGSREAWEELVLPEDRDRASRFVQDAMATGSSEGEWRVIPPGNSTRWLFGRGWVLRDDSGKPLRLIGVNIDITERKQAELEVLRLNADLERRVTERTLQLVAANRELEAFAYSVSHDLRAPLRGIDGWSLALAEDYAGQLDDRAHKYLDRVRSETRRMGLLIDALLQLSRITRAEMERNTVDLSSVAQSIAGNLREAHADRRIEFTIGPGLNAAGDARLLEIALTNLLDNAVKFTGPLAHAQIEFGRTECDGERAWYVRDNGVGFDMAFAGTLFGAFQRVHKISEFPGTGIGLATVQRIIHRHGGRIWAEAQPNHGATFYFILGTA